MKANSQSKATISEEKGLPSWRALKEEKGLRGDTDVALILCDW